MVNDPRVGAALRGLRHRRHWRQDDLAFAAHVSQTFVSDCERGQFAAASLARLRRLFGALDAGVELEVRWRGGALDRVLDERHAVLIGHTVKLLQSCGWLPMVELSYSRFGERGSIDVVGWHLEARSLIVVEVKTELTSVEAMLRKLDEKVRLAPAICREAQGWPADVVSRVVVLPPDSTPRRAVARHAAVLDATLPARGSQVREWLKRPTGSLSGILFVSPTRGSGARRAVSAPKRIRRPAARPDERGTRSLERVPLGAMHLPPP